MFTVLMIIIGFIAVMLYLLYLYGFKCLIEFIKEVIDWKILRYMLIIFFSAIFVFLHYVIFKIVFIIFF